MKFIFLTIVLCVAISVAYGTKLLASSTRQMKRRETKLVKRLVKRQALNGKNKVKDKNHIFSFFVQIQIVIDVLVMFPIVVKISLLLPYLENAAKNVYHGNMQRV